MPTQVVNIRSQDYDVYIGRAGHGQDGYFGNPVRINKKCPICVKRHQARGETLECYKIYFYERIKTDEIFRAKVKELKNKRLGCFCKPRYPCHGDIIKEYLEGGELPRVQKDLFDDF